MRGLNKGSDKLSSGIFETVVDGQTVPDVI